MKKILALIFVIAYLFTKNKNEDWKVQMMIFHEK
jgi:hypothetical protein